MTSDVKMSERGPGAWRGAGAWYLVMGVGTAFGMGYVDPLLRASEDGEVIAGTIRASQPLLNAGLASTATGLVAMLFLAGALYGLFESVDRAQARLLVVFVGVGVSMALLNLANLLVAMGLARGDGFALAVEPAHRIGLMMTFLAAYRTGGSLACIFWGLWLLPFGLLLLRSGFAPRALGALMVVGCFAYLLHCAMGLFFPSFGWLSAKILVVPTVGEFWAIAWLLLEGPAAPRTAAS